MTSGTQQVTKERVLPGDSNVLRCSGK